MTLIATLLDHREHTGDRGGHGQVSSSALSLSRMSSATSRLNGSSGFVLTGSDMRATGRWALDRDPYLLETSVPGIFACGEVRYAPVKRVAAAVGEGSMSIAFVHQYLREAQPGLVGSTE